MQVHIPPTTHHSPINAYSQQLKAKRGFTLIELLVTITVMAILIAVAVVAYSNTTKTARDAKRRGDMDALQKAVMLYSVANNNQFPVPQVGTGTLSYTQVAQLMVDDGYLVPPFSTDPLSSLNTGSNFAWLPNFQVYAATSHPAYAYVGTSTEFCACAALENEGSGNSNAGAGTTAAMCTGLGTAGDYYCVRHQ